MLRVSALVILSLTASSHVGAQSDVLTGTDIAEDFRGGIGDDTMIGGEGADTMLGGNGDDTLKGGPDDDRLGGGNGDDVIRGDQGSDVVASGADDDVLAGGDGSDFLIGGPGNDTLLGGPGDDMMLGGTGSDMLSAEGGRDLFFGGPGNDLLLGQLDADTCVLQPSDDDCVTISFGETCDVNQCLPFTIPQVVADSPLPAVGPSVLMPSTISQCAGLATGTVVRSFAIATVPADGSSISINIDDIAGDFTGAGLTFSTTSCCTSTCETITPFVAGDDGTAENIQIAVPVEEENAVIYAFIFYPDTNKDLTFIFDAGGEATIQPGVLLRGSAKPSKEPKDSPEKAPEPSSRFVKHTKEQFDIITKACAARNATCKPDLALRFQSSIQLTKVNAKRAETQKKQTTYTPRISPTLSPEVAARVKEATGEDIQIPKAGPNGPIFVGGKGDDILRGRGGDDRMAGQDGSDSMIGAQGSDVLLGAEGNDLLIAGPGDDVVQGNSGSDDSRGGAGDDTMIGGPGDDVLRGNGDNDVMAGAVGNDILRGNAGADTLDAGEGDDQLFGGTQSDVMFGDAGQDQCFLQPDDNYLIDFDDSCDNELCAPFTETLVPDTETIGEVFVATQPSVRFECDNTADNLTVEGAQVFTIDTSAFVAPTTVQIQVSDAQFEGTIALSESCCAQQGECVASDALANGAAVLTQTFADDPDTVYVYVTSSNQTSGTFTIEATDVNTR